VAQVAVCSDIHTKQINTLKTQFVPRCKQFSSRLLKPVSLCCIGNRSLFVLRSTQNTNTLCGQNVAFVNVKLNGAYSNHGDLEGKSDDFIEFVILMIYVTL